MTTCGKEREVKGINFNQNIASTKNWYKILIFSLQCISTRSSRTGNFCFSFHNRFSPHRYMAAAAAAAACGLLFLCGLSSSEILLQSLRELSFAHCL